MCDIPVSLFLVKSTQTPVGSRVNLTWAVVNHSEVTLNKVKVNLSSTVEQSDWNIQLCRQNHSDDLELPPKTSLKVYTPFDVVKTGRFTVKISVTYYQGNTFFEWIGRYEPEFEYIISDGTAYTTTIELNGPTVLKNIAVEGNLHIKADKASLIKNISNIGNRVQGTQGGLVEECMPQGEDGWYPLELVPPTLKGIRPLDFQLLHDTWRKKYPSKNVRVSYLEEAGRPCDHSYVNSEISAQIRTYESGYLILVTRGTSGRYYLLYPNNLARCRERLPIGSYTFPGRELFDLAGHGFSGGLVFQDSGREFLLALLSPQPIDIEAWNTDNEGCMQLDADALSSLIEEMCQGSQPPCIGLGKIEIHD